LAAAAWCRKELIIRLLLENGAEINNKLNGLYGSALVVVAEGGNMKVVRLLLERGAEVNA
jgi:ankyrin repeat protein